MKYEEVYQKIAQKLGKPKSEYLIHILEKTCTPEEGELLLNLPGEPTEIAKKVGESENEIRGKMLDLARKGLVMFRKGAYFFPRDFIQFHDASLSSSAELIDTEVCDLWREWYENGLCEEMANYWAEDQPASMRVVVASKALQISSNIDRSEVMPFEDPQEIMKGANTIVAVGCPCRRTLRRCDRPAEDICIQFNKAAEYSIERGAGRELCLNEALELVDIAAEKGLVHTVGNSFSLYRVMCNCCGDCCLVLHPLIEKQKLEKGLAKSRFQAGVDQALCTGCQNCLDRCYFDAIEMVKVRNSKKLKAFVNAEKCYGCGLCTLTCEAKAITMSVVRPVTYIPEIARH